MKHVLPLLLAVLLGTACNSHKYSNEPAPVYYSIATKVVPEGAGTVLVSVSGAVLEGSQVTFTAQPAEGYVFSEWGGTASGWKTNPKKVSMYEDQNVIAYFVGQPVEPEQPE